MFIKFLVEKWKMLFVKYFAGIIIFFGIFYWVNSNKPDVYRSDFTLNPKSKTTQISFAINDLIKLLTAKDTINFSKTLNLPISGVQRIESFEQDILEGGYINIEVVAKDTGIINPFRNALIEYLNTDSMLNTNYFFIKSRIKIEMDAIKKELLITNEEDASGNDLWDYNAESGQIKALASSSSPLNRVFLIGRLNKLAIEHFSLLNVQPVNVPAIPNSPETASKLVYFIFSNIIILSLLFLQFLFYSSRHNEDV